MPARQPALSALGHSLRQWRRASRGTIAIILAGLVSLASGCGDNGGFLGWLRLTPDDIIIERQPNLYYERLFPYYVEICAVSQWHRHDGRRGNPFGHAVMYLKGACKDETAAFPLLRRCRAVATTVDDPEHGAGVSVGRWFRNVNWVATPDYGLFYTGNLKQGDRLTQVHLAATVRRAIADGVFDGVELHENWTRNADWTLEDFVTEESIATDFALQFARNVFCARVPVTEPVLDEVIAFLNDKNYEYATGEADYHWSLLAHNCVHTVRNALAAANFWRPISVLGTKALALLDLAVPANEFVNLAILGAEGPLGDYRQILRAGPARDAIHEFGWLPTRHGALVKTLPVHQPNDIYDTTFRLFAVQSPVRTGKTGYTVGLLSESRYVDLRDNLVYFRDQYERLLAARDEEAELLASVRGSRFRRIGRLHRDYLEAQRAEVEGLLSRLATLEGASRGIHSR